jgi:acyl carrier protein
MKTIAEVFSEALRIPLEDVCEALRYNSIPQWDSVAHMALVAALEDNFGILLETDDVIGLETFAAAKSILSKYGVSL